MMDNIFELSNLVSVLVGAGVTAVFFMLAKAADSVVDKAAFTETDLDNQAIIAVAEALHSRGLITAAALKKVRDKLDPEEVFTVISPSE